MDTSPLRVYGGVEGDHRQAERRVRLIEAGLDLLGAEDGDAPLSVRGVCKRSGLAARYFYESFPDRDTFAVAVFDHVVDRLTAGTLRAIEAVPDDARAKTRAGLANLVHTIAEDPRWGRLLYTAPLASKPLARRRLESARTFAAVLGGQARDFYGVDGSARLELASQFIVGGFAQTMTAWLGGTLDVGRDDLVEQCADVFLAIAALTVPD